MASSTPPPHCSITSAKPHPNHHHRHVTTHPVRHAPKPPHPPSATATAAAPPHLSSDFSGRRSTRFVSKMHFGRPKSSSGCRHSATAEEFLHQAVRHSGADDRCIDSLLLSFEGRLSGADDFTFLLRELGNRGEHSMAIRCFEFAVHRERRRNEQGKLASAMISVLGRLGKVELARNVFDTAVLKGYGNTVYAYSALISAYGKSGMFNDAVKLFRDMKGSGLVPNLITYNALIDACAKGGGGYEKAKMIFDEMTRNGVQADRITYNSLLAVCSAAGMWGKAWELFNEMDDRGIDQDIFTYNTLIDVACNSGDLNKASEIMAKMPSKNVWPNEVTYSTMVRAWAKAGKFENALNLFNQMKFAGIRLDRVSYNTLLAIYAKLGRFEEALGVGYEMESMGIKKDVVTYNALLDGYGKQGRYDKVKALFKKMKEEKLSPNLLTYSTLISVYSKGGLYREAKEAYKEFKQEGLRADVVFYSELIDSLCKKGLVESSAMLLDEMTEKGIRPNVVTYNSIINAFGLTGEGVITGGDGIDESKVASSNSVVLRDAVRDRFEYTVDDRILKIFEELASQNSCLQVKDKKARQEVLCVLGVFQRMHELKIKPNVVTFSAILNACSRCNSFEEASLLLEELRLFDNNVYGVAHGLLLGYGNDVWNQAESVFTDMQKNMDSSTASAFYNALTDMLWHFGQRDGAQRVVLEGKKRQAWPNAWSDNCLDLHLMSAGAARAMVHAWLLNIHTLVGNGHQLPNWLSILTGWGKHSKVVGDGALKKAVESLLTGMDSPFRVAEPNLGRFITTGALVSVWLSKSGVSEGLILRDYRTQTAQIPRLKQHVPELQAAPL